MVPHSVFRGFIGTLLLSLPRWFYNLPARVMACLWFDVFRIRRGVALSNLAKAFPELEPNERVRIARESCFHLALNLLEFIYFPFFDERHMSRLFKIEGYEHLEQARGMGKGALLLGLHLGNGDLGIAGLSRTGMPVHLISKEFRAGWLNRLWFDLRRRHGTRFISVEKSTFEILRALKSNELVIFVLDQFMGPPSGVPTTFFSHPTGTAAGLALFAERSGAPVIPCYCFRDNNGRNCMVFGERIPLEVRETRLATVSHMTQVYTDEIECIVRRYPEQWMWIHRRWKNFA